MDDMFQAYHRLIFEDVIPRVSSLLDRAGVFTVSL